MDGLPVIVVSLVVVLVVVGSLIVPVPHRWRLWTRSAAVWWRDVALQRLIKRRLLLVTYLGLVAIATLVIVIWALPSVLTRHPHVSTATERHTAITQTRLGLGAILAAIGAAGGLAYTARTYRLAQETYRLSREGHITDRYSKAVEQLGSEKIEVRLGGIYALERLMQDNPPDQRTIMEALAAYVRQHSPRTPTAASVADRPAEDV
jgi:hypothetical protein